MPPWIAAATFVVGIVLGALPVIAAFASRLAVAESRIDGLSEATGRLDESLSSIRRDLNGIGSSMRSIASRSGESGTIR